MADCGCGGSSKKAARSSGARQPQQPTEHVPREGGPQERGSSYYSRAGRYTGPPPAPSK